MVGGTEPAETSAGDGVDDAWQEAAGPFCQTFSEPSGALAAGWSWVDLGGSAAAGWSVTKEGKLGPDQHVRWSGAGGYKFFDTCVASEPMQMPPSDRGPPRLAFEQAGDLAGGGANAIGRRVLLWTGEAEPEWSLGTFLEVVTEGGDLFPEVFSLPPSVAASEPIRVAFCLSGSASLAKQHYELDGVCLLP